MSNAPYARSSFVQASQHRDYSRRHCSLPVVRVDERIPNDATAVDDVGRPQGQLAGIVTVVLGQIEAPLRLGNDDLRDLVRDTVGVLFDALSRNSSSSFRTGATSASLAGS
jgi:hypothetical protein